MNHPNKITPIVYGTITMTLSAVLPIVNFINIFCCAGIMLGGFAGVYVYWKQLTQAGMTLTAKDGGMIGILCGILSAVFITGFGVIVSLFSESNPMMEVLKSIEEIGLNVPPEMNQYLEKFSEEYNKHGFSPSITIFSFVANMIMYPLFGSIGAIIGVNILGKKKPTLP